MHDSDKEEKALIQCIDNYYEDILNYLYLQTGNPQVANKLTKKIYFKLVKQIEQFQSEIDLKSYLFSIAKKTLSDSYRKKFRIKKSSSYYNAHTTVINIKLIDSLHSLNEENRELILLNYYFRFSNREIAELIGRNEYSVRMELTRLKETYDILFEDYQPLSTTAEHKDQLLNKLIHILQKNENKLPVKIRIAGLAIAIVLFGVITPFLYHHQSINPAEQVPYQKGGTKIIKTSLLFKGESGNWKATNSTTIHKVAPESKDTDNKTFIYQNETFTLTYKGDNKTPLKHLNISIKTSTSHGNYTSRINDYTLKNKTYTFHPVNYLSAQTDTLKVTITTSDGKKTSFKLTCANKDKKTTQYHEMTANSNVNFLDKDKPIYNNLGISGSGNFQIAANLGNWPLLSQVYNQKFGMPDNPNPVPGLFQTTKGTKTMMLFLVNHGINLDDLAIKATKPNGNTFTISVKKQTPIIDINNKKAILAYVSIDSEGQWTFTAKIRKKTIGTVRLHHFYSSYGKQEQSYANNQAPPLGYAITEANWTNINNKLYLNLDSNNQAQLTINALKNFKTIDLIALSDDGTQSITRHSNTSTLKTSLPLSRGEWHLIILSENIPITNLTFTAR